MLPQNDDPDVYLIRTDFSDDGAWLEICEAIRAALREHPMDARFIEDRKLAGATPTQLLQGLGGNPYYSFALVIDKDSMKSPEFTVLVLDLLDEPGRTFRVIPKWVPNIHVNLWLANMDFEDYADDAEPDGVFRGFSNG